MQRWTYITAWVFLATGAKAIILAGGDGTQNTTAPPGGQGWDYVGRINKGSVYSSVTYVSNNWFITANHIKVLDNPSSVVLGGSIYTIDPNSWTRMQNSIGGDADLIMFRVVGGVVGLPGLTVRTSATGLNSPLTMIGNGRNREATETHWNALWAEVTPPPPATYSGYKWVAGSTKRWGTNNKGADVGLVDDNFGVTDMFIAVFDDVGGSEAQGATYDSGGGVFYDNSGDWELAGIMVAIGGYNGQPGSTAVYGNLTYMADMQHYAAQIGSTVQIDDIDEDGIPDLWEYEQSGSTTGIVASIDQDNDGFTGQEEWIADTDPTDGNSYLRISTYTNAGEVVFASSTNRRYRIDFRTDLADTNETWQTEVDWFIPVSTQSVKAVTIPTGNRFFRLDAKLP